MRGHEAWRAMKILEELLSDLQSLQPCRWYSNEPVPVPQSFNHGNWRNKRNPRTLSTPIFTTRISPTLSVHPLIISNYYVKS